MTVAVTGASGFCGSVVARQAAASGADVICLGRRPGPVGTQRSWDAGTQAPDLGGVDVVVHLAAAVGDPTTPTARDVFRQVNVDGTRRLLDVAAGRPVVWVSSASVYDPRLDRSLVTEEHPTAAGHLNAYGRTKAEGDRFALQAGAVVLRPHAVYGLGDRHLLPRLRRALRGRTLVLPGRDVTLSLTAVENLASACLAAPAWEPGAYNVADAVPYPRDATLATVLGRLTGRSVRVVHGPVAVANAVASGGARVARVTGREPVVTRYAVDQVSHDFVLDITKALGTGWAPQVTVDDFLRQAARS